MQPVTLVPIVWRTYMLALCIASLTLMLMASSKWVQLTGQENNAGKSMGYPPLCFPSPQPRAQARRKSGKKHSDRVPCLDKTMPTRGNLKE